MAMKEGNLWVNYDDTTDVLYLSVGDPRPARRMRIRMMILYS